MKSSYTYRFFWSTALLITGLIVTACGGGNSTATPIAGDAQPTATLAAGQTPAQQEQTQTEGVTALQLMGWASSESENLRLQEMVDSFNATNPDIQVTLNQVPDYDTKLQTSLAGGTPPDVFYVDSLKLPDLVKANALLPIGDQLENVDDFYPSLRQAFTVDGVLYCPPKDFSTLALEYNKDLFDQAGVAYPSADWTWDDLKSAAEKLTNKENGVVGLAFNPDFARWIAFIYQSGGSVTSEDRSKMTLDSPEVLQAFNYLNDMIAAGTIAQAADLDSGWPGEAFGKQKAAMTMEGNWIVPFLKDQFPDVNYGVAELPQGPKEKATMAFTVCYAVPASAKNPEASIRLVNYLTGAEGMKAWTDLGLAMPTRASLREGWVTQFPELQPFLNGAEYARPWQFFPGFQQVLDSISSGLQQLYTGGVLPEDVLKTASDTGAEVLAK